MSLTRAVYFLVLWSADGTCNCRDGSCNEVCTNNATVPHLNLTDGFCNAMGQLSMTHQEMCCACPQWECSQTWSNGDPSACDGHAGGSCDQVSCTQCYHKAFVPEFGDTVCGKYVNGPYNLGDKSVVQCAQACTAHAECNAFEYWDDDVGNYRECKLCVTYRVSPDSNTHAKRRSKWLQVSSSECAGCTCFGAFCFCECTANDGCWAWGHAPKSTLIAIPWLLAAAQLAALG
ncbi:unnamed protein product [Symbiodinium natans]|uniref:Apple domain-containing protein n=1 Tax=Symbiodinium natans TaxID=878477 RepID=A0A812MN23_9DINO|nr:unnamed protein product [Symbiodinium natans]